MTGALLVAAGAAIGAPLRYLVDRAVGARYSGRFPWGTFAANVAGSLVLGMLTGATLAGAAGPGWQAFLGTGLCGALTTYSTFSFETLRLAESGARGLALANVSGTVVAGLAATYAGLGGASALLG
ncbi:chromosome condensation protein CrcB [Amycolatopsis antarctica]|uniref:Fluoride-specific ion channel FluC n=1 Tax=Amycolatopsis antarctica TaxID=1854586 RepID=A0A263D4B5_9PSEU|nr:fluoride efflux transporter CrcB [Amycolatopsis antarctica]OZM72306.1 chromosome condensation protein CrcB [Amycolatopsis antarctica]